MTDKSAAEAIVEATFASHFPKEGTPFRFRRQELVEQARRLGVDIPKNLSDTIYAYRFRNDLPKSIRDTAPDGWEWVIRGAGKSIYEFGFARFCFAEPRKGLQAVKVLDATPEIVSRYRFSDEQALLAVLRYNRLVDLFTTTTCYLLQSHLRTTVAGVGQVETDDLYVGVDRNGTQYAIPIQAKGGSDRISVVKVEQDLAVCREKLPELVPRSVAAQFLADGAVALFEFALGPDSQVQIAAEKHYRLVSQDEISAEELAEYAARSRAQPTI